MKYYSIDEDVFKAILDIVREQSLISKMDSDREALMFYDFLIDQLLDADEFETNAPKYKRPDDKIRLDKVERYLRMFHEQLDNFDIENKNKKTKKSSTDEPEDNTEKNSLNDMLREIGIDPCRVTNVKRNFKRDNVIETMSLDEIEQYLKDDPQLSPEERFELYYFERQQLKNKKKRS